MVVSILFLNFSITIVHIKITVTLIREFKRFQNNIKMSVMDLVFSCNLILDIIMSRNHNTG